VQSKISLKTNFVTCKDKQKDFLLIKINHLLLFWRMRFCLQKQTACNAKQTKQRS